MRLTTDYREQPTGVLQGTKCFFLACHVAFTEEERAVVQERGMYDEFIEVPSDRPPPTRSGDFGAVAMRVAGLILIPVGLLTGFVTGIAGSNLATPLYFLAVIGIALFVIGKMKDRAANKYDENPNQRLTLRKLLANPEFLVYATALDVAKMYEEQVRNSLQQISQLIRESVVVPEKNTYDL